MESVNSLRRFTPDDIARANSYPLNPASPACPSLSDGCMGCVAMLGGDCLSKVAEDARIRRIALRMVSRVNVKTVLLFVLVAVPLFEILNILLFNFTK